MTFLSLSGYQHTPYTYEYMYVLRIDDRFFSEEVSRVGNVLSCLRSAERHMITVKPQEGDRYPWTSDKFVLARNSSTKSSGNPALVRAKTGSCKTLSANDGSF